MSAFTATILLASNVTLATGVITKLGDPLAVSAGTYLISTTAIINTPAVTADLNASTAILLAGVNIRGLASGCCYGQNGIRVQGNTNVLEVTASDVVTLTRATTLQFVVDAAFAGLVIAKTQMGAIPVLATRASVVMVV